MNRALIPFVLLVALALAACGGTPAVAPEATLVQVTPLATATDPPPPTTEPPPSTEAPAELPATEELAEKMDSFLSAEAEAGRFVGAVLVARDDEIILSEGYGLADRENSIPNTPQTRFRIASLTKAFTAMAIMQLQEQGKLTVDDPVCDYLDDCPAAWEPITIHHLLTHTSGISTYTDQPKFIITALATPLPPSDAAQLSAGLPLEFEAGSAWSYSNAGYVLLGLIIERVSGQTYEAFLQEYIFDPLGMADTGYDHNRDDLATGYVNQFREANFLHMSIPFAAGALYSTVEDFHRWTRAVQSDQLVSRETLDLIFTPYTLMDPGGDWSYGYGWSMGPIHERPVVGHAGQINGFTSDLNIFPEDGVTTVVFSNQEDIYPWLFGEILSKWALGIE